jgi:hypothetical protein
VSDLWQATPEYNSKETIMELFRVVSQVSRNGITRPAELGGDSRERNTKFTLRHDAGGSISGQSADIV